MNKGQFIDVNNLLDRKKEQPNVALFKKAFRPFFILAVIFASIHIPYWLHVYQGKIELSLPVNLAPSMWHAHEMIFGYAVAVIIAFLLTAVSNWTGQKTMTGKPLIILSALWLSSRILYFYPFSFSFIVTAILDTLVLVLFTIDFTIPIIKTRNIRQNGFVAKLVLLIIANILFYLGVFGILENGVRYGLYLGLYLVLAVVLVLGRRVIPFFIQRGVNYSVEIKSPKWLDISSLIVFTIFTVWDVFFTANTYLAVLSLVLFALYSIRLYFWHTVGIWKKPLLWVLWLSFFFLNAGFLLKSLAIFFGLNPYLATHAFALGGIGLVTVGMMARVSLGHTGRDVFNPPKVIKYIFMLIVAAYLFRVILPIFLPSSYMLLLVISSTFWAIAFLLFVFVYLKILIYKRPDGKEG